MTFVNDDNEVIEFNGQFAMTKQSVSLFNSKIKGDISITFSLDDNSVNRKILGYYGPQMINQVAFTKQRFSRIRNGNILDRGYLVIQSDDDNKLSCFYVSGNSNWMQLFENLITQLDYSKYAVMYTAAEILNTVSSTSGMIFPFVDWIYNLKKGNTYYYGGQIGNTGAITDSTNSPLEKPIQDFFPCFYLHSLVSEIGSQNNFKIEGNILDDQLFKSIVITPTSGLMKRESFKDVVLFGSTQTITAVGVYQKYTSFTVSQDPEGLFNNNTYTANKKTGLVFKINVLTKTTAFPKFIVIFKNGSYFIDSLCNASGQNLIYPVIAANPGDTFEIYVDVGAGAPYDIRMNVTIEVPINISALDWVEPSNFLPKLKQIDIIKFCINYFGCVCYFNEYSKTINITIIEKIKIEDSLDWSQYFIGNKNTYTVSQAKNNYLRFEKSNDSVISNYNNKNIVGFGDGNIQTGNTLKDNQDMAKFPFTPSSFGLSLNTIYQTNIPLIDLVDDGDPISFTALADGGADTFGYNSLQITVPSSSVFSVYEIIRISNSARANLGYYLVISKPSATLITVIAVYYGTDTGKIYKQTINYADVGARILAIKNNTNISDFSQKNNFSYRGLSPTFGTSKTNFPSAHFTKPKTSLPIDNWKANLSIDNPQLDNYIDPTVKELYFNKVTKFLQNPNIEVMFLIPEAVYQSFDFSNFIYLKTEKLTGYFFVESIVNYVDGNTPVEVNLYML